MNISHCRLVTFVLVAMLLPFIPGEALTDGQHGVLHAKDTSTGPVFLFIGDVSADLILLQSPTNLTLNVAVNVWDSDGVDLVICSYKESDGSVWTNVSMAQLGYYPLIPSYLYGVNATTFTMTYENPYSAWDVKFFAVDNLGNWNTSEVVRYHYAGWKPPTTTTTTTNGAGPDFAVAAAVITTAIIIAVAVLLRPKKEAP